MIIFFNKTNFSVSCAQHISNKNKIQTPSVLCVIKQNVNINLKIRKWTYPLIVAVDRIL